MKANASRSRSFDSGTTRMPRSPTTMGRPSAGRAGGGRPRALAHHDHGVHALILDLDPLLADAHKSAVVGGGIEIFGGAAVALHLAQHGIAGFRGRAPQLQEVVEEPLQGAFVGRLHLKPEIGGVAVGSPDAELLHFEPAVMLHDLVEDVLHDVGIDQVAFGFDHFLDWHTDYYCNGVERRALQLMPARLSPRANRAGPACARASPRSCPCRSRGTVRDRRSSRVPSWR